MIRTFLLLAAVMLAFRPGIKAQTTHFGAPVRIQVPGVMNLRPVLPGNNYVYQYPNGYASNPAGITVRRAPIPGETQNLSNDPDPVDHLNGLLLSRNPQAQSNQLNFPLRSDVRYSNREVANVQQDLRRQGYYTGMVDGIMGPNTRAAIQQYQLDHDLPVTGLLDSGMLSQLGIVTRSR
jgi:hypothetical protein